MPDRTISILSIAAGALVAVYVVLVITTVTFAAWQTDLALTARDAESTIGDLETKYYEQVGVLAATDPRSMNLGKPAAVTYATEAQAPALSLR